ncbi:hypothetical protein ES695_14910 [Candidatus Atribacteria bacterium 1244-E10-H5-B2]|nr:MAG: hypothetical protein ES695_14910 [Candidatus Atribacteria bacterium 1244-E10-H5-B2]
MRISVKVIRFIFVFFLFSFGMSVIRDMRIPILIFLWALVMGYYALWEFGLLKKKDKHKNIKEKTIENPGDQKNEIK